MPPATKIICVGSPFGDDQAGGRVYRCLRERIDPGSAEVIYLDRPGACLIEAMQGASTLILVDAVKSGAPPGTLHCIEGEPIYRHLARHTSTHGFGLADALQLAQRLGSLPPKVLLFGVELRRVEAGEYISAEVEQALEKLTEAVHQAVSRDRELRKENHAC